jgi:hypothetical protein
MATAATSGAADIEQYFGQLRKINVDYRLVVACKRLSSEIGCREPGFREQNSLRRTQ